MSCFFAGIVMATAAVVAGPSVPTMSVPNSGSSVRRSGNYGFMSIFNLSKKKSKDSVELNDNSSNSSSDSKEQKEPKDLQENQLNCNVCFNWRHSSMFPLLLTCEHRTCIDCLRQYLTIAVKECRVMVSCPECSEVFHPSDVKTIFDDDALYNKYEEFTLRRALVSIPDIRWCPAPDCGYAIIATGCASCPQIKCMRPGCNNEFCYHCRQLWHPNTTCDVARIQNQMEIRSLASSDRKMSRMTEDIKTCPKCGALIIKMDDGSCNHMTCAVCGGEFCWLCMKEISDLHYLRLVFRLKSMYINFCLIYKGQSRSVVLAYSSLSGSTLFWTPGLPKGVLSNRPCPCVCLSVCPSLNISETAH